MKTFRLTGTLEVEAEDIDDAILQIATHFAWVYCTAEDESLAGDPTHGTQCPVCGDQWSDPHETMTGGSIRIEAVE